MLRQLVEYAAGRLPPVATLYSEATVRYVIQLDSTGRLLSPMPLELSTPEAPRLKGRKLLVPQVQKTSGVRANLVNGNAEYTLGLGKEGSRPERVRQCHEAYVSLLRRCADRTGEPSVQAVVSFLEAGPRSQLTLAEDFDPGAVIVFQVDDEFPTDLPSVQRFWATENDPGANDAPEMQCIICGQRRPVLRVLQQKVKGLRDGQSGGTAIISANNPAFFSYGLENSLVAPTCATCAEGFTRGINDLLAHPTSCYRLGGAEFIYWTREDTGFSFLTYFDEPKPTEVRALLQSVWAGGPRPLLDDTPFYAAILSGSVARAVVRDWIDTTLGDAKAFLAAWFEDQAMIDRDGADIRPLGLYPLAAATVRDPKKDLAPPTIRALLRAALTATPAPSDLLARAVRRNRADGTVNHQRAALIKLVLARQVMSRQEVRQMAQLVADHPSAAYHCGRLLAVLDTVQRAALGAVNATIVDRYFGTASSAPGTVFPYLVRGSAPHLAKLRKTRPGAYQALQQRLEEVMDHLPSFQPVLTLQEQGLFALGYYHQRADDRRRIREAAERRRADASTANATPDAEAAGELNEEEFGS